MKTVLCVEDNPEMRILMAAALTDHRIQMAETLAKAQSVLKREKVDLILLDLGLPDGDGFKLLTEVSRSQEGQDIPVLIVSSRSEVSDKVMAFAIGAEDYIAKPFDPQELRARVEARLKRRSQIQEKRETFCIGDLLMDILRQKVILQSPAGETSIDLTSLEFKLLLTMARHPERIFSRDYLLDHVWGHGVNVTDRTVDTHIGHLRKKICGSNVQIETVIGSGYRVQVRR